MQIKFIPTHKKTSGRQIKFKWTLTAALFIFLLFTSSSMHAQDQLPRLLEKTAQYCQKLKSSVFHFLCYESISEKAERTVHTKSIPRKEGFHQGFGRLNVHKPKVMKSKYIHEYQIIKEDEQIKERRVLVNDNGQKVHVKNPRLRTLLYSYKSSLSPIYFFDAPNQPRFNYKILSKEGVMGRSCFLVEVRDKKKAATADPMAHVWVDRKDYSILKFKLFAGHFKPERLAGSKRHNITDIKVQDIHYFGKINNGLRFPTKTELFVSYYGAALYKKGKPVFPPSDGKWYTKIKTTFKYKKYIFFNVSVGTPTYFRDQPTK